MYPRGPIIVALGLGLAACGCGRKPEVPWGTAEGKVLLDGVPVTQGTIIFDNASRGVARLADIQADGSFVQRSIDFPGLPVGHYRVAINPLGISKGDFVPAVPSKTPQRSPIPERYHRPDTSGLTAEVSAGENGPFKFSLSR
jgi:hypothetical protein